MIGLRHAEAHGEDQSSIKGCPIRSSETTSNVILIDSSQVIHSTSRSLLVDRTIT
jgi:hypothetical protein